MKNITAVLKALADKTRFRIVNLLLTNDLCVGALASRLEISEAAVSQHLQVLRKAQLVAGEKRGYWTHYTVQRGLLHEVAAALSEAADRTICVEAVCPRASFQNTTIPGRKNQDMCKDCCEHPHELKEKSGGRSYEQMRDSHAAVEGHLQKGEGK
jgi:ArsR family transcriptional regulator